MTEQNRNENDTPREDETAPEEQQNSSEAAAAEGSDDELPTISEDELNSLLEEAMSNASASDSPAESEQADGEADAEAEAPASAASEDADDPHGYLADLKRLQADYANYRRRTDREKEELAEITIGKVVKQLLPVLDDLDRAEAAGDLESGTPMEVIATKFRGTITRMGVECYGEVGEVFNPQIHEAVAQLPNPEVSESTIADVIEVGYRIGEREIRPAKVAVFVAE